MKILLCSLPFAPSVGGIETVSALLAERFHRAGHQVRLVTGTPSEQADTEPFEVLRRPGLRQLLDAVRWSDVVFHSNVSLKLAWPLLWVRRPWVVAHHTWIPRHGAGAWAGRLKRVVLRRAHNVAISQAIAASLPMPCTRVPNPYADDVFKLPVAEARTGDLVFVGRLVSDKGVHVLIDALAALAGQGLRPSLSVVGDGPERAALQAQVAAHGLQPQVTFAGQRRGAELVGLLQTHRLAVVPSVWEEPFGLVALEAMACGCVPVVARSGGLPEAVGAAGAVFDKGDAAALATTLARLLADPALQARCRAAAPAQLERHTRTRVAEQYLKVLHHALGPDGARGRHRHAPGH